MEGKGMRKLGKERNGNRGAVKLKQFSAHSAVSKYSIIKLATIK
jgi:hypothetical protein